VINTNQNDYIACFTEDNEMRTPSFCDDKLEKNFKKIIVKNFFIIYLILFLL